uniref:non-ribosomal peptide synthetase n=1 Tax=Tumebacillus lacus TaxID=2995335 RepID=UPI00389A4693
MNACPRTEPFHGLPQEVVDQLPRDVVDAYPLTALQTGMIYHMTFTEESISYHNIAGWYMRMPFDRDVFEAAVARVVERHAILRTSFDLTSYVEPLQLVHERVSLPLRVDDLRHLSDEEQEREIESWMEREIRDKFDLACPPMLRLQIHLRSSDTLQFFVTECHAILDGWSLTSIVRDIFSEYFHQLRGLPLPSMEAVEFTYRDYVWWERAIQKDDDQRAYWQQKIKGVVPTTLPSWQPSRARDKSARVFQRKFGAVPLPVFEALQNRVRQTGVPLKNMLLAAHLKVLSLATGTLDVQTGLTANGRPELQGAELQRGLFLNTLPYRMEVKPGTWDDLIREAFRNEQELLPYRRFPMAEIQKMHGRQPLFETSFNFVHFHAMQEIVDLGDVEMLGQREIADTNFTLQITFCINPTLGGLTLMLDTNGVIVTPEQNEILFTQYLNVLEAMATAPQELHHLFDPLTQAEHERLSAFNDTAVEYDLEKNLHQWIEEQVDATPDAVAVVFGEETLTYRELDRQANRLAHQLVKQGVQANDLVGVSMERSMEMVVGLLGILKAGGAYLPLDPDHPAERMAFVLEDSQVRIVLTQEHLADALPSDAVRTICLDRAAEKALLAAESAERTGIRNTAEDTAYCIYTSGSTGKPKGALISHQGICNRLLWMQDEYRLNAEDRVLQKTPYSFDVSVWEFFWPLMTGARLVVAEPGGHRDTRYLARLIAREGITTLHFVPSMLHVFLEEPEAAGCTSIRRVICSGEALPLGLQQRFFERLGAVELHNLYGPTEASVDVSYWQCQADSDLPFVPIGRPIANIKLYILDERMQPVPIGVAGELYISGIGVAKGYLNRPELTAERFVPDPFETGANMYKTGDAARWLPDGNIEYIGRLDNQVKLRGLRIELGEVESVLGQHPAVREAVVTVREDVPGGPALVGYYVLSTDGEAGSEELRAHLKKHLPEYMVPSFFVELPEMPLSSNGKTQRSALPAPQASSQERSMESQALPANLLEERIADIWADILHLKTIDVQDDFFAMGGHSFLAFHTATAMQKQGIPARLTDLYQYPTVRGLAEYLGQIHDLPDARVEPKRRQMKQLDDVPLKVLSSVLPNQDTYTWEQMDCFHKPLAILAESFRPQGFDLFSFYAGLWETFDVNGHFRAAIFAEDNAPHSPEFFTFFEQVVGPKLGLKLHTFTADDEPTFRRLVEQEIGLGRPVMIPGDLYGLYYTVNYRNEPHRHFFIVKGVDPQRDLYFLLDNMHLDNGARPTYRDFYGRPENLYEMYRLYGKHFGTRVFWSMESMPVQQTWSELHALLDLRTLYEQVEAGTAALHYLEQELLREVAETGEVPRFGAVMQLLNFKHVLYDLLFKFLPKADVSPADVSVLRDLADELSAGWGQVRMEIFDMLSAGELSSEALWQQIDAMANREHAFRELFLKTVEVEVLLERIRLQEVQAGKDGFTELNRLGAAITRDDGRIVIEHAADTRYDSWIVQDDAPQLLMETGMGQSFDIEVRLHTETPIGASYHAGLVLKLQDGRKLLFGIESGELLSLYAPEQLEFTLAKHPYPHMRFLRVEAKESSYRFMARASQEEDWFECAALSLQQSVRQFGLFSKTWEPIAHTLEFTDLQLRVDE